MKTLSRHVPALGLIVVVSLLVLSGCGTSRRQYAINEALLIDQTRLLENEIYKTRYQLQKVMDENARLKEELGIADKGRKSRSSGNPEEKRLDREEPNQGAVPFAPPTLDPKPGGAATQRRILVIPQSQLTQDGQSESLPQTVVDSGKNPALRLVPVSKQAPAVSRLPGPGEASVPAPEPRKILVVPNTSEPQSETLPQSIIQPTRQKGAPAGSGTGITPQSWDSGKSNQRVVPAHYNSVPTRSDNDLNWSPVE
ncbi:MAG: hypothetical protein Q4G59_04790 [Planctomycetia bacterium]|nr:hypothetical protein [Planctomycetia bacterium]